jgi:hypothetical protein
MRTSVRATLNLFRRVPVSLFPLHCSRSEGIRCFLDALRFCLSVFQFSHLFRLASGAKTHRTGIIRISNSTSALRG